MFELVFNILVFSVNLAEGSVPSPQNCTPGTFQVPVKVMSQNDKKIQPLLANNEQKIHLSTSNDKRIKPLVFQKNLPNHIKTLNNGLQMDVLTNKIPPVKDNSRGLASTLPNYTVVEEIDDLYYGAVSLHRLVHA